MSVRLTLVIAFLALTVSAAWADHGGPLRTGGWSPMTAALVFGGLALLAGMLVVVIVTLLSRRDRSSS
ncbi:MAG: hypothetical protein DMD85_10770 [Candidatus Rokuibacteriota bacterium]|nr:MAG: hypothetical protein DMD85_10770 [Candidatus Rokubacteria bacterium]